jgi:hypothetical protein
MCERRGGDGRTIKCANRHESWNWGLGRGSGRIGGGGGFVALGLTFVVDGIIRLTWDARNSQHARGMPPEPTRNLTL